jgi:hypothetical protein
VAEANTKPEVPNNSPLDKMLAEISVAIHQWTEEQRKNIGINVRQRLDKHRDHVLMSLMGFEKDYWNGRDWKIDNCNGRGGNSPISDFLKQSQDTAIREWLAQIRLPVMTPKFKKDIEKELAQKYQSEVRRNLWSIVQDKASKDLEELLESTLAPTLVGSFLKAQELINPPKPKTT